MAMARTWAAAVDQRDVWHVGPSRSRRFGADRAGGAMRIFAHGDAKNGHFTTKKRACAAARFQGGGRQPEGCPRGRR